MGRAFAYRYKLIIAKRLQRSTTGRNEETMPHLITLFTPLLAGFDPARDWKYVLAPVVCAFIGWLTNYVAVKMLFRPRKAVNIGICSIQGVFPKRQSALAENLGRMIEKNLFNHSDIQKVLNDPGFHKAFTDVAEEKVSDFLNNRLAGINPMIAMFLNDDLKGKIRGLLMAEMEQMLPELLEKAATELEKRLIISDLVRQKVEGFSSEKVEELLFAVMKKEFRFIEIVGGVLGFLIGVAQTLLFAYA